MPSVMAEILTRAAVKNNYGSGEISRRWSEAGKVSRTVVSRKFIWVMKVDHDRRQQQQVRDGTGDQRIWDRGVLFSWGTIGARAEADGSGS